MQNTVNQRVSCEGSPAGAQFLSPTQASCGQLTSVKVACVEPVARRLDLGRSPSALHESRVATVMAPLPATRTPTRSMPPVHRICEESPLLGTSTLAARLSSACEGFSTTTAGISGLACAMPPEDRQVISAALAAMLRGEVLPAGQQMRHLRRVLAAMLPVSSKSGMLFTFASPSHPPYVLKRSSRSKPRSTIRNPAVFSADDFSALFNATPP